MNDKNEIFLSKDNNPDRKAMRSILREVISDSKEYERHELKFNKFIRISVITAGFLVLMVLLIGLARAETMQASYYSMDSLRKEGTYNKSGGIMANGKIFDENALTCAAGKQYKLGTKLLITNLDNGKSVLVTVTDRIGKIFYKTRIDLSKGAFLKLGCLYSGLIPIKAHVVNINIK